MEFSFELDVPFVSVKCGLFVTLVRNRSVVVVADHLARQPDGPAPGMLNPSDPLAVRAGYIGMFWDGGASIGAEEVMAARPPL